MTAQHCETKEPDIWKDGVTRRLDEISGQIEGIKKQMVTRKEYNDDHAPLVKLVGEHEALVRGSQKTLTWIGVAALLAALFSPHSTTLMHAMERIWK